MLSEFDLIARYFTRAARNTSRIALGVGDDCALVTPSPGMQLAISTDMLVESRHFFPDADPFTLGHKCLAVNLSDLAAMGAKPVAFTLALALPQACAEWLAPFAQGMLTLADEHGCELIGGDTTKGPLNICITVFGELAPGSALRRDRAQAGDDIWISGTLGDARLALAGYRNELALDDASLAAAAQRMHAPTPRVALGLALRGIAHAAIDISDGLLIDALRLAQASGCAVQIAVDSVPLSDAFVRHHGDGREARLFAVTGGDDYALLAALPNGFDPSTLSLPSGTTIRRIGVLCEGRPAIGLTSGGRRIALPEILGHEHLSRPASPMADRA